MTSIIYRNPLIYKIVMKLLHGKSYVKRYALIAKEAGDLNVLDLCCGDCELEKYVKMYKGADFNPVFIKSAKRRGLDVIKLDVLNDEIPRSECIVMQASLYQLYPKHKKVIKKILKKAKKANKRIIFLTNSILQYDIPRGISIFDDDIADEVKDRLGSIK